MELREIGGKVMKISKGLMLVCTTVLTFSIGSNLVAQAADGGVYGSKGIVEFEPGDEPTSPVDPENPDPQTPVIPSTPDPEFPVNPGTPGPLSIDYASHLSFGHNKITNKDMIYYADAQGFSGGAIAGEYRGNYVQVTDKRGTLTGWTLTVKQDGQFSSESAKKAKELKGAEIRLTNSVAETVATDAELPTVVDAVLDPSGSEQLIMSAADGQGDLTWVDRFGEAEAMEVEGKVVQKNKAVTLSLPGATSKEAVKYTTSLIWTLTDTPGN